ncbi:MAG: DUF58 domain-containing protein [Gammaproteobacteria bacterium]|nr:DUF58 domain-containing protein [Gammaproteobacteria bacterium]
MPTTDIHVQLDQLIALQRASEHVALINQKSVRTERSGSYLSRFRGRGMDFDETRNYQAGDDIRFMDWRVMARTGRAHTKLFCEERERPVFIVLDQSLSMRFGSRVTFKSIVGAQAAAILAWAAVQQGDRVGGVVFHDSDFQAIKPRSRKQGILPLFRHIVRMNHEKPIFTAAVQFEQIAAQLRRICHPGGLVFIISDFTGLTPLALQHLRSVGERSEIIACFVSDPLEQEPPPPDRYEITNGEKRMLFDTYGKDFCKKYREKFIEHYQDVKSSFIRQGIPLLDLSTKDDVGVVLYQALLKLRGRGLR